MTFLDNAEALERRFGFCLSSSDGTAVRARQRVGTAGSIVEVGAGDLRWMRLVSVRDPLAEAACWVRPQSLDHA